MFLVDTKYLQMAGVYSDSDDEYYAGDDYEDTYSESNMGGEDNSDHEGGGDYALGDYDTTHVESGVASDDEDVGDCALGDHGTIHVESGDSSDDEDYAIGDYGITHSESHVESADSSDDEDYAIGDYGTTHSELHTKSKGHSAEQHHALGDYGTSRFKSMTLSGGSQVNVHQQTFRAKNEDKQNGSYERFTAKDKAVCGEPFVDRSGNRGYKDEHTRSDTYKVGDKSGFTEYYREEKVKHVEFDKRSSNSNKKAVGYYPKYNKY